MIREIVSRFTSTIAERRAAVRSKIELPIRVSFASKQIGLHLTSAQIGLYLIGRTTDLSSCGIGFIVPSIRIKENYLVAEDRVLDVEIDAYGKKIMMKVCGRRYEEIGLHHSTERYMIGAAIVEMSEQDRRNYEYLLKHYKKLAKVPARSLELGLD